MTAAITSSSASAERTGKTAAFATAEWLSKTCSTSNDEMFSPRRRIASLSRSTNRKLPSGWRAEIFAGECKRLVRAHEQLAGGAIGDVAVLAVDHAGGEAVEYGPHRTGL